jgi:threonyl-tRNA synthetase
MNGHRQRLYGTAWFSSKDMQAYLDQLEEAKKRDHRVIGKELGSSQIMLMSGRGMCLLRLPKGCTRPQYFWRIFCRRNASTRYTNRYTVRTWAGREMYETSGHFPYYRDEPISPRCSSTTLAALRSTLGRADLTSDDGLNAAQESHFRQAAEILGFRSGAYRQQRPRRQRLLRSMNGSGSMSGFSSRPMILSSPLQHR